MPVVDNRTANRNYPLPDLTNLLSDDWPRLIAAFTAIDADIANALITSGLYALKNSPAFTGTPLAPTATPGTSTDQLATTAFVAAALDALVSAAPGTLNTLNELAAALGDDPNYAATVTAQITAISDAVAGLNYATPAERFVFTATGGETSIAGADDHANTLAYNAGRELVFLNGVMMVPPTDYTAADGVNITGIPPLTAGDSFSVVAL